MRKSNRSIAGILCMLFACMIFVSPVSASQSIAKVESQEGYCYECSDSQIAEFAKDVLGMEPLVLSSQETKEYIQVLKNFKGIKDVNGKFEDHVAVMILPTDYVFITAINKKDPDKVLFAVIDAKKKEIVNLKFAKTTSDGYINIRSYDTFGNFNEEELSIEEINAYSEKTQAELIEFISTYNQPSVQIEIPTNWEWYVCKFAGFTACTLGCGIFIEIPPAYLACKSACSYYWGKGLCDDYK